MRKHPEIVDPDLRARLEAVKAVRKAQEPIGWRGPLTGLGVIIAAGVAFWLVEFNVLVPLLKRIPASWPAWPIELVFGWGLLGLIVLALAISWRSAFKAFFKELWREK